LPVASEDLLSPRIIMVAGLFKSGTVSLLADLQKIARIFGRNIGCLL
jgi:hypothetical protein